MFEQLWFKRYFYMTTGIFDKKLLEFMYFLTTQQKFMNSQQISKVLTIKGKKVTDRTIRRWFTHLKKDRNFNYFPYAKYEKLGLLPVYVFIEGMTNPEVLEIVPYNVYVEAGINSKTIKSMVVVEYFVPFKMYDKFDIFWRKARKLKLIKNFKLVRCKSAVASFSPFHRAISNSHIDLSGITEADHKKHTEILREAINEVSVPEFDKEIKKNPLIALMLLSYFREHYSSTKLWSLFKKSLGEKIWDYVPDYKIRSRKRDSGGIKFLQKTLKHVHSNYNSYIRQLRVSYKPFYAGNTVGVYITIKLKNKDKFLEFASQLAKHSLIGVVHPSFKSGDHSIFHMVATNANNFTKVLGSLLQNYVSNTNNTIVVLRDFDKTHELLERPSFNKVNYTHLLDPQTCEWRYEHKKYLRQLESLVKTQKSKSLAVRG